MSRKTRRAGAIASATMIVAALFAVEGSGANAQSEIIDLPAFDSPDLAPEPEVRFVASPVVQELPEQVEETVLDTAENHAASLQELVSETSASGDLSREMSCLARAVYFESRGEALAGQLAVARVIVNRSESPLFPDDYCGVVTQKSQFSFVKRGRIPSPNTASTAWARAEEDRRPSRIRVYGIAPRGMRVFFHAQHVRPRWANRQDRPRYDRQPHLLPVGETLNRSVTRPRRARDRSPFPVRDIPCRSPRRSCGPAHSGDSRMWSMRKP